MNREIELHADGNEHGYCVVLKISGREFSCCGKYGRYTVTAMDAYNQIADAVKDVYGENLCEDSDKDDIVDALVGAENIVRALNCWGRS